MSKRNADRPAYEVFASAGEGEKPTPKYNNFVSAGRTLDGVGEVKEREKPSDFENTAPVDNRPLYEILREKEAKKQEEWQKLHNPFQPPKAMDEDEVQFLEDTEKLVRTREEQEAEATKKQLERFRSARDNYIHTKAVETDLHSEPPADSTEKKTETSTSQRSNLKVALSTLPTKLRPVKVIVKDRTKTKKTKSSSTATVRGNGPNPPSEKPASILGIAAYDSDEDGEDDESDKDDTG